MDCGNPTLLAGMTDGVTGTSPGQAVAQILGIPANPGPECVLTLATIISPEASSPAEQTPGDQGDPTPMDCDLIPDGAEQAGTIIHIEETRCCLLYTSPSPRD